MNNLIHIGHCLHAGADSTYHYGPNWKKAFNNLPYFYSIAVTRKDNASLGVCATLLVKSDMGQTADEVGKIYASLSQALPTLYGLPADQVNLSCTKISVAANTVPTDDAILQLFADSYARNPAVV